MILNKDKTAKQKLDLKSLNEQFNGFEKGKILDLEPKGIRVTVKSLFEKDLEPSEIIIIYLKS